MKRVAKIFCLIVLVSILNISCKTQTSDDSGNTSNTSVSSTNNDKSKTENDKSKTDNDNKGTAPVIKYNKNWIYLPGISTASSSLQAYWIVTITDIDGDLESVYIDEETVNITGHFYSKTVYGKVCYGIRNGRTSEYYDSKIREVIAYDSKGNSTKQILRY